MEIAEKEKIQIQELLKKWEVLKKEEAEKIIFISWEHAFFTQRQTKKIFSKFQKINPNDYGFFGKKNAMQPLISQQKYEKIQDQEYGKAGKIKKIETQYIPIHAAKDFFAFQSAMQEEIQKTMLVESGYRSPAYQMMLFLYYLQFHNWDFKKVITRVALPEYSEHNDYLCPALDFMTKEGIPSDTFPEKKFEETKEFQWLEKNAQNFNFFLSYPKNNSLGVIFEPWHWRWKGVLWKTFT